MWTPRRILLMLLGLAGCVTAYLFYSRVLGGIDGLPQLPQKFAVPDQGGGSLLPDRVPENSTVTRLKEAFGPGSPEVLDTVAYKTRLEDRLRGMVFACGPMEFTGTPKIIVSPFSVAMFSKPKPAHLLQPGEVREVSTFHADRAELEFDRPVNSPQDLQGRVPARLTGITLFSVPDMPSHDPRRGQIWVTNNQRSPDPGQHLVFHTPGPLYYRSPEPGAAVDPNVPQVWTHAAVEVIDRRNLPRPLRSPSTATSPTKADELRARNAVADILLGTTLPPPTMTAEGMKMYLEREGEKPDPAKRSGTGYSGVRQIELTAKVQINLWSEGTSGFPGSAPADTPPPKPAEDPPALLMAVAGGAGDGAAIARKLSEKTLMVIETLGPFRYDFPASRARFEAAAIANPALTNVVTVTRLSAAGGQDNLVCQVLVIDFFGNETEPKGAAPPPKGAKSKQSEGMRIKALTATGPSVYVSAEAEGLQASGTELHYDTDPKSRTSVTRLHGAPVFALKDRNRLQGGTPQAAADVVIVSTDPPPGSKEKKKSAVEVRGPGRIEMFDQSSEDNTLQASWGRSLTQEKVKVGEAEQDLLKFEGGGSFADVKGDMRLSAERLWLWLASADPKAAKPGDPSKALPQKLLAVNNVTGRNAELEVGIPEQPPVDQLTVWFRDVPPPPPEPPPPAPPKAEKPAPAPGAPPPAVAVPTPPGQPAPPAAAPAEPPKKEPEPPPEKPKPPIRLAARVIESWVIRYPVKPPPPAPAKGGATAKAPAKPPGKEAETALKYELERARCDDRVVVHQDPEDPLKNPRGLDITGIKLNLESSKAGSVLTVTGPPGGEAQVKFESMEIYGPAVLIDQPNNAVAVDGLGRLVMPSQNDAAGNAPSKPTEMEVRWVQRMRFFGAKAWAEFVGKVQAVQRPAPPPAVKAEVAPAPRVQQAGYRPGPDAAVTARPVPEDDGSWGLSSVWCHHLQVTFDRPIYFNNYKRTASKPPPKPGQPDEDSPKLKTARCTPAPDDELAKLPTKEADIARRVYYLDESFDRANKRQKAQLVIALQLDVDNNEKDRVQKVDATGPGEVRLLQYESKDPAAQPQPQPTQAQPRPATAKGPKQPADEQEMKLTLVRFPSRMQGVDKGKVYQEATFFDGARVWQTPTENIGLTFPEHAPPPKTTFLTCTDNLKVSSSKPKPDAAPEQWMVAQGNGEFFNDDYRGYAARISYKGEAVIFDGSEKAPARLFKRERRVSGADAHTAQQIIYHRDGRVETHGSGTGTITSGGR